MQMGRARSPDSIEAEKLYQKGWKLVDIAAELNVKEGTIRSWKNRYQWDGNRSATLQKKKCNVAKEKNEKNNKKKSEKKPLLEDVELVIENDDLTDKQRFFCLYYVKCFNATKAYQKAYGTDEYTAMVSGSRMLRNVKVRKQIEELKEVKLNREMLTAADIVQKYIDIAFSNMTDYAEFGTESFTYIDKRGEEKEGKASYVRLKDSSTVDGTLIQEVKMGKDGASIKLKDGMKALQWLSDHMDLATEEQRLKIEILKRKVGENEVEDKVIIEGEDEIEE